MYSTYNVQSLAVVKILVPYPYNIPAGSGAIVVHSTRHVAVIQPSLQENIQLTKHL